MKIPFVIRFSQSNKSVKTLNFTVKERVGGVFEALKRGEVFLLAYLTIQKTIRGALSVIKAKKMLSGENHDVRWIAAHERLKSYGCDQKAALVLRGKRASSEGAQRSGISVQLPSQYKK